MEKDEKRIEAFVDKLLANAFGGSAKKLVMQALGSHKTSNKELEEIKKYIEQLNKVVTE